MIDITSIPSLKTANIGTKVNASGSGAGTDVSKQFGDFLNQAITKLNDQQTTVQQLTERFATGDLQDVHQLLIASEKASLGLELAVQVRNKAIEAYQEIMRMQI
ncbi:flagellar hook-basal body complex protein FliE [Ferviditalea candida]|uniref:Flagellar hook-basal body complex protein FliE n=1 Tax=Ferviditalea candida TaxID=3108399 RepID=A0ABU5ZF84_9BACL|nr:flagellar hook-basal body complex protein FliE [Paenibacillaceae bacterium T2]